MRRLWERSQAREREDVGGLGTREKISGKRTGTKERKRRGLGHEREDVGKGHRHMREDVGKRHRHGRGRWQSKREDVRKGT